MIRSIRILFVLLLSNFFLHAQQISNYKYISPIPNSEFVSKETNIIIRYGDKISRQSISSLCNISIVGSASGSHETNIILSDDDETIVLNVPVPFYPNEIVNVHFNPDVRTIGGTRIPMLDFSFKISPLQNRIGYSVIKSEEEILPLKNEPVENKFLVTTEDTLPADFPKIIVKNNNNPTPGYIFITTSAKVAGVGYYAMMIKDDGKPYWYKKFDNHYPADFKMQPNGMLSYADMMNDYYYAGGGEAVHKLMDSTYTVVDSFKMGNGYVADGHDFKLLPNGHALLFAYDLQQVDMSKIVPGGNPAAMVAGSIIQELDANKNVVFQWRSWDYIPIVESYFDLTLAAFDPIHANTITQSNDGNIIASFRNLSQVIKIDKSNGNIIWRLGGKKNQFTFIGEHAENAPLYFSRPHGVVELPNGNIMLFDNGLDHSPKYSRAVEYKIDETNKTATLVWEYKHPDGVYGATQGSVQRLSNGNTLICWGSAPMTKLTWPSVTEVKPNGSITSELFFENKGILSLHAFKYLWKVKNYTSVTEQEILKGNEYTFNCEGDSTYVTLKINNFSGSGYNSVTVSNYSTATIKPEFIDVAPIVLNRRLTISANEIDGINAEISIEAIKSLGVNDPKAIVIYHREHEGSGVFTPLSTSYNFITKRLTATFTKFGEFVFATPVVNTTANPPLLISPADSSSVNQSLSVKLKWTPLGYAGKYHLQIASDYYFQNIITNLDGLAEAFFQINSVNASSTYYWRVRTTNISSTSDWSKTFSFITAAPGIVVTYPDGSEKLQKGLKYYIRWKDNIDEEVIIEL
ncbi:MAG: aryl-sulfate sulfotransferase, partial [Melioribacteraceae bacterium]